MHASSLIPPLLALTLAPLLRGVINRTKAISAGRVGPPILQPYHDLLKLLRKGAVYSEVTSPVFRAGPVVGLAVMATATALLPFGAIPSPIMFPGDLILFAYLFAVSRFFTVLAALDTGSSFEGMGASREVTFSARAEPAFLLGVAVLARLSGELSLSPILLNISTNSWVHMTASMALTVVALLLVFLAECGRIPVDDPATHLELTMIHEVMVLDHGGPDLAMIEYSAAIRMWLLATTIVSAALPSHHGGIWFDAAAGLIGMAALAIATGIIESTMARLRLVHVPRMLLGATALAAFALVLTAK